MPASGSSAARTRRTSDEDWFWGVNGLTVDMTVGAVIHGYTSGIDDAKAKLRAAFDMWTSQGEHQFSREAGPEISIQSALGAVTYFESAGGLFRASTRWTSHA